MSGIMLKRKFTIKKIIHITFRGIGFYCALYALLVFTEPKNVSVLAEEFTELSSARHHIVPISLQQKSLKQNWGEAFPHLNVIQAQSNQSSTQNQDDSIDLLLEQLAKATSEEEAHNIANQIEQRWLKSGSDTVDLLMRGAEQAMLLNDFSRALDILDAVIRLKPNFAEGWNRRATIHFILGSYDLSISDIEQTLAIEPKHWGAMSGFALIMENAENPDKAEALKLYEEILKIHPFLPSVLESVENLKTELSGQKL